MNMTLIIIFVIVGAVLLFTLFLYNSLIRSRLRVHEAFSQIDVQLKRRADLIPNLIETVKGYAKHEKETLTRVTELRTDLINAKTPEKKAEVNNQITDALKSIFAVAESYPDLKASENFKELQTQLQDTEDKIAYSRQFYNSNVLDYNTKLQVFPNVILVKFLSFKEAEFFGASEGDKKPVKVTF